MIRHLNDITPTATPHAMGQKRVLLSSHESGCSLTQIADTELRAGEVATAHVHPDMQEGFYVLSSELEIALDGVITVCQKDTFVYVDHCTSHELRAITNARIMTIGCVIEASRNKLYPILFKQNSKTLVWGTEDWTVFGVPNSESEVENGTWARYNLTEVIARRPAEILGKQTAQHYYNQLPLLTKIIDAYQDLSIQVHPDDKMALREHNKFGKSEMWYILDAEPGAFLYAGFKQLITPEEYKERVANGTICEVLAKHEVQKSDVFYLPAGRAHAICGGIKLAEVQQSSDVTYRIYPEYKTEHEENQDETNELLNTPYFSIKVVETSQPFHRNMIKYYSFVILTNIGTTDYKLRARYGACTEPVECNEITLLVDFLPHTCRLADYDIIPTKGNAKVMETFIKNKKSIGKMVKDFSIFPNQTVPELSRRIFHLS